MKKLLALAAVAGGVLFVVRRNKSANSPLACGWGT
ncbi:MAG: DLW-39 family protein [Pseudonocardiaceae bacterium]|nr:DLW-39 family protein [Pseudonocardiaceae bacterium]